MGIEAVLFAEESATPSPANLESDLVQDKHLTCTILAQPILILRANLGTGPSVVHWAPHSSHQLPAFLQSYPWPLGGPWRKPAAFLLHCRLPWSGSLPSLNVNFTCIRICLPALGFLLLPTSFAKNQGLVQEQNCPVAGDLPPQGCMEEISDVPFPQQ